MNRTIKRKLIVASVFTLVLFVAASSTFAEPEFTDECGDCHEQHPVNPAFTMSSNSTGNATVEVPFTLRIVATKPTVGGIGFWLSVQAGWADNDNFNFTPAAIVDNSGGDLTPANFIITHDFTFTPLSSGNYTIKAWCATYSSSQYIEIPILVPDIPDETPPVVDSPADIAYVLPTTDHNIVWNATDEFPSQFNIQMNGTVVLSGGWNGQPISINVDYLSPGTYVYNLTVIDTGGNAVSDVVIVTVTGEITIPPTTTTTTTTTGSTDPTSTTDTTTSGGNPAPPGDNEEVLVTATFSLIMVSTGIIVGVLIFLLILDKWRPWN